MQTDGKYVNISRYKGRSQKRTSHLYDVAVADDDDHHHHHHHPYSLRSSEGGFAGLYMFEG